MSKCVNCLGGLHLSCQKISCDCNHSYGADLADSDPTPTLKDQDQSDPDTERPEDQRGYKAPRTRTALKRDAALIDQQSTGRKRAARWFPLDREKPCEWKGLAEVGGGLSPTLGCADNLQQARHHGPDKSVSNNEIGNVHRICHFCHNRWHAANNKEYDWNSTLVNFHNPRTQTSLETFQAMQEYDALQGRKQKRIKD